MATRDVEVFLSTTKSSAASKKSRVLNLVGKGVMSVEEAIANRENDTLLGACLTELEITNAKIGIRKSKRASVTITIEVPEDEPAEEVMDMDAPLTDIELENSEPAPKSKRGKK